MNRRIFLSTLGATGAGVWARFVEPNWFDLTRTTIRVAGVPTKRILHIADLHVSDGMTAPELERGVVMGLKERPDVICVTGDFVSTTAGFDAGGLTRLLRRAADTAPTLAVLGNHDGGRWLARAGGDASVRRVSELVESAGVTLLHNRSVWLGGVRFVGLGDLWAGGFDARAAFDRGGPAEPSPRAEARAIAESNPTIVLCHNPDGKDALRHVGWDLMLSGHTHGGQARVPGLTPEWAPVADKRYIAGLYSWEGRQLFITRGLGSPKHVRAFCRPEVSLLEVAS